MKQLPTMSRDGLKSPTVHHLPELLQLTVSPAAAHPSSSLFQGWLPYPPISGITDCGSHLPPLELGVSAGIAELENECCLSQKNSLSQVVGNEATHVLSNAGGGEHAVLVLAPCRLCPLTAGLKPRALKDGSRVGLLC